MNWMFKKDLDQILKFKIKTISELQVHINILRSKNTEIYKTIKENSQKIEDLNKCLAYAKTVRKTKATYQEYESKKIFKESFYKNNQKEIDQHIRARTLIEKISGKKNLREKEWSGEIKSLEEEISKLNTESENIRERYKEINHIKYAVEVVNEEYGIDLSIEIDKAIKRGEKERDDEMSRARVNLDWEKMFELAIDSEKPKKYRKESQPIEEDSCTMCGKMCSMRTVKKVLNGEDVNLI